MNSNACSVDTSDKMLFAFVRYVALNFCRKREDTVEEKISCPKCDVALDKGLKFCSNCGAKLMKRVP